MIHTAHSLGLLSKGVHASLYICLIYVFIAHTLTHVHVGLFSIFYLYWNIFSSKVRNLKQCERSKLRSKSFWFTKQQKRGSEKTFFLTSFCHKIISTKSLSLFGVCSATKFLKMSDLASHENEYIPMVTYHHIKYHIHPFLTEESQEQERRKTQRRSYSISLKLPESKRNQKLG